MINLACKIGIALSVVLIIIGAILAFANVDTGWWLILSGLILSLAFFVLGVFTDE